LWTLLFLSFVPHLSTDCDLPNCTETAHCLILLYNQQVIYYTMAPFLVGEIIVKRQNQTQAPSASNYTAQHHHRHAIHSFLGLSKLVVAQLAHFYPCNILLTSYLLFSISMPYIPHYLHPAGLEKNGYQWTLPYPTSHTSRCYS
jgi:hypothetical protein